MTTPSSTLAPGTFCWADLGTTDAAAAKHFYGKLLGWEATDVPAGEAGTYSMLSRDGKLVAALYEQNPQVRATGLKPYWQSYVLVANADETARKAAAHGGTVLMPAFDVMDVGRMAVIQDPAGAAFAVWEGKKHFGAQVFNTPGAMCWNELTTKDVEGALKFYTEVFGWGHKVQVVGGTPYYMFDVNGRTNAGMMAMDAEMQKQGGPTFWLVYFTVADVEASFKQARELGATVIVPPFDIPTVGRMAIVADPQGAVFAIIKLNNPQA